MHLCLLARGAHRGGDMETCLSPLQSVGFLADFCIHVVFCGYKIAYRVKSPANGSRAIELLLSKLACSIKQWMSELDLSWMMKMSVKWESRRQLFQRSAGVFTDRMSGVSWRVGERVIATYQKTQSGREDAWLFARQPAKRINMNKLQLR